MHTYCTAYRGKSASKGQSMLEMRIKKITKARAHYGASCAYVMFDNGAY
jgi:hypothetical protein